MFKWIHNWLEARRKQKLIRDVLPLMYEEIQYRQRAIIYTLLRKDVVSPREALDLMTIMTADDFGVWMKEQPKLKIFNGPSEISEDSSYEETPVDDVGPSDDSSVADTLG